MSYGVDPLPPYTLIKPYMAPPGSVAPHSLEDSDKAVVTGEVVSCVDSVGSELGGVE